MQRVLTEHAETTTRRGGFQQPTCFAPRRLIVPRTHDDSFNPCAAAACNKYICVLHVALRSCDARLGHLVLIRPGGPADRLAPGKPPARLLLWCRHAWSSSVCLGAHSDCRLSPLTLDAPRWCRTSFLRPMPCSKARASAVVTLSQTHRWRPARHVTRLPKCQAACPPCAAQAAQAAGWKWH